MASPSSSSSVQTNGGSSSSIKSEPSETTSGPVNSDEIYQFKVMLIGVKPPIWRRIQVEDMTFSNFHEIVNSSMGWQNYHLYQFIYKNMIISESVDDDISYGNSSFPFELFGISRQQELDSQETTIKQFFKEQGVKTMTYVYDFGDNWRHKITLEKMVPRVEGKKYPICITGRRACPPEDCGGIYGYDSLLKKLSDPTHEEYEELQNWMAGMGHENFDPNKFDMKARSD